MADDSSAVISAVGKVQSPGTMRSAKSAHIGPAAPTASSRPYAPPATQKKVRAMRLVRLRVRRGRMTAHIIMESRYGECRLPERNASARDLLRCRKHADRDQLRLYPRLPSLPRS